MAIFSKKIQQTDRPHNTENMQMLINGNLWLCVCLCVKYLETMKAKRNVHSIDNTHNNPHITNNNI